MNLKPLHDRVIIKADDPEEVSKGGIYLPDTAKKKSEQGEVIAVGPGKTEDGHLVALQVKAGDKVLFGKYSAIEITVDNEEYLVCHETDILAIL